MSAGAAATIGARLAVVPFDRAALFGTAATIAVILLHAAARREGRGATRPLPSWGLASRLVLVLVLLTTGGMAFTAWLGLATSGVLRGWILLAHLAAAPLFLAALVAAALGWAGSCRIPGGERFGIAGRAAYWAVLATGLVSAGSILLSMQPWLGTEHLEALLDLHRWSGLACFLAAILLGYASTSRGG